jgi:hypothetical protein
MQLQIAPNDNVFRINSPEIRSLFLTKRQFLFVPFGPRNPKIKKERKRRFVHVMAAFVCWRKNKVGNSEDHLAGIGL